jgi:hypothetical protein
VVGFWVFVPSQRVHRGKQTLVRTHRRVPPLLHINPMHVASAAHSRVFHPRPFAAVCQVQALHFLPFFERSVMVELERGMPNCRLSTGFSAVLLPHIVTWKDHPNCNYFIHVPVETCYASRRSFARLKCVHVCSMVAVSIFSRDSPIREAIQNLQNGSIGNFGYQGGLPAHVSPLRVAISR